MIGKNVRICDGKPQLDLPRVTVTSTDELSIHSIASATAQLAHRSSQPHDIGKSNALIAAVVRALSGVSPSRATQLVRPYRAAKKLRNPNADLTDVKPPIEIRTDSRELIEAGEFLRAEPQSFNDETQALRKQLLRFDVSWVLLPLDGAEIEALKRWGELARLPFCATDSGSSTQSNGGVISRYPSSEDTAPRYDHESSDLQYNFISEGEPLPVAA
ncbi:hypothetical protein [Granulicella paludicola]|uniref:hypothetical protein n=1 Tax=Granulicella paludicola TaxID=474951 RepID=UPI0021E0128E|nr:hypothetical protein [Granulicella paludicola]